MVKPIETIVEQLETSIDNKLTPERQSAFSRFPKLFTLAVAFGVSATYYGFKTILTHYLHGQDNAFLILMIGLIVLLTTGTLYKKF